MDLEKCLNCCKELEDSEALPIDLFKESTGRRALMKIYELTKIDYHEGVICENCDEIIESITKLEISFLKIRAKSNLQTLGNEIGGLIRTSELIEEFPENVEPSRNINNSEKIKEEKNDDFKIIEPLKVEMDLDELDEGEKEELQKVADIADKIEERNTSHKKLESGVDSDSENEDLIEIKKTAKKRRGIPQTCNSCGFRAPDKNVLEIHLHSKGKYHNGSCLHCGKKFESWTDHKDHIDTIHDGKMKYSCGFCNEKFDDKILFTTHTRSLKNVCKMKKEYYKHICPECGMMFLTETRIESHHKLVHENSGCFECKNCDEVFKNPRKLKQHFRNVHLDPVNCEICGKVIKSKHYFDRHMKTNHTSNEEKDYKCDFCPKAFAFKRTLNNHRMIHTGEKPFKCNYCDAKFTDLSTRRQHEQSSIHLGVNKRRHKKRIEKAEV